MSLPSRRSSRLSGLCLSRLGGADTLLSEILAFWALWHCRHARPPDAVLAT